MTGVQTCALPISAQSLERFFDQWVRRPGNPTVEVDYTWDDSSKTLKIVIEQTQRIDADNPAYAPPAYGITLAEETCCPLPWLKSSASITKVDWPRVGMKAAK